MTIKNDGYTLIELLIVLSIIVIFSALSLAYYRQFDEQRKLDAEAKQLVDVLNLASKKARSADISPYSSCTDFQGYRVKIKNSTRYKLQFNCGGSYSDIQFYDLRAGLTLSGSDVVFKPLSAETDSTTIIKITNSVINKCINIQINPVGTVEEVPNCIP